MPGVGFNTIFRKQCPTVFKIQNIAPGGKRIKVFTLPLVNGGIRDLMDIPHVSEADIRHSLLKGELNIKIRAGEIHIVDSNIDLLQFDECHKQFLMDAGIIKGLEVTGGITQIPFVFKQGMSLIGVQDGINTTFTTLDPFIQGTFGNNTFKILIRHNGRVLQEGSDYVVLESGGVGTGYDTVIFKCTVPGVDSEVIVDYVIEAP